MRSELHKVRFWLLPFVHWQTLKTFLHYVPGNMEDAGNIAVNTANDILIDMEPIFPWIFESGQETCWSIRCKLIRNSKVCRPHRFSFLPISLTLLCPCLSSYYSPTTWLPPASCLQTHEAHFLPKALDSAPMYLKCASSSPLLDSTLLNIQIIFSARPSIH